MAAIAGLVVAAYGAYSADKNAKDANKAMKSGGYTDQTTTTTPWEPTLPLRNQGLNDALDLYKNYRPQFHPYAPGKSGGGGGGGKGIGGGGAGTFGGYTADQLTQNPALVDKLGPSAQNKWKMYQGGGGTDASIPKPSQAKQVDDAIINRGLEGTPLSNTAEEFARNTLNGPSRTDSGEIDTSTAHNKYLYDELEKGAPGTSQYLKDFIERRMAGGNTASSDPSMQDVGELSSEKYIREILDGKYLNEGNPYADKLIDSITRRMQESHNNNEASAINAAANARGRLGSEPWANLQSRAMDSLQRNIGDVTASTLYDVYNSERGNQMSALSGLAGLDVAKMGENSRRAGMRAGEDSAYDNTTLDAILGEAAAGAEGRSYFADLIGQLSGDKLNTLNMSPEIDGMGRDDLMAAKGVTAANQARQDKLDAQRAARRARDAEMRRQYDIDKWEFEQNEPFRNLDYLAKYQDLFGGGFGSTHTEGRNVVPMGPGVDRTAASIGGAMQGWQMGNDIYGAYKQWQAQRQQPKYPVSGNRPDTGNEPWY